MSPRRWPLREEALDGRPAVMGDDLREVELRRDARRRAGADLGLRHPRADWPSRRATAPSSWRRIRLAQLPRVLDASRRPDVLVAAEDHQRLEAVLARAIGVGQAVLRRVLARQERDDVRARARRCRDCDEMAEVVFLPQPDGAVGEEHERAFAASVRGPRDRCRSTRPCSPRSRARRAAAAAPPRSPADR